MKFHLSTLLLLATVIILAIGWFVDRNRSEFVFSKRIESVQSDQKLASEMSSANQFLNRYLMKTDRSEFDRWANTKLVATVQKYWQKETQYNSTNRTTGYDVSAKLEVTALLEWVQVTASNCI